MMYKGIAVGGPAAGEWIECEGKVFHKSVRAPIQLNPYTDSVPSVVTFTTETYHHAVGLRGEFDIDLWLHDGLTVNDALALVFRFYGNHAKQIGGDDD